MYVLLVLRGDRGDNPGLARLVDRVVPTPKKKQLKRKFFDFKQKKTRKGIKAVQSAIIKFNVITRKHMNALFVFYFYVFFSEKPKCFKQTFAEKKHFFLLLS